MTEPELLPCPFCKSECGFWDIRAISGAILHQIKCQGKRHSVTSCTSSNKKWLVELWNTRK